MGVSYDVCFVALPCCSERHTVAYNPGEWGWVIEDNDYPGVVYSFLRSDPKHWRGVKVRLGASPAGLGTICSLHAG